MRGLALADVLASLGSEITFLSRSLPGNVNGIVRQRGHQVLELPSAESTLANEIRETERALGSIAPDWLIVDHYALDRAFESRMRPLADRICVIDDLFNRPHDCDLLLNQSVFEINGRYDGLVPKRCHVICGPHFALLKKEYFETRQLLSRHFDTLERVLIAFGGADHADLTERAVDAMASFEGIEFDVVVGRAYRNREALEKKLEKLKRGRLHIQLPDLAELMAKADVAIGAGGTTSWERCCLGLPSVIATLADNQNEIAKELSCRGCTDWVGDTSVSTLRIAEALQGLLPSASREAMSQRCLDITDGQGAIRFGNLLLREPISPAS